MCTTIAGEILFKIFVLPDHWWIYRITDDPTGSLMILPWSNCELDRLWARFWSPFRSSTIANRRLNLVRACTKFDRRWSMVDDLIGDQKQARKIWHITSNLTKIKTKPLFLPLPIWQTFCEESLYLTYVFNFLMISWWSDERPEHK